MKAACRVVFILSLVLASGVASCGATAPTLKQVEASQDKFCADLPRLRALERLATHSDPIDSGAAGAP